MKLLDLDSSLSAHKQLADELHYSGNMSDTASKNIWLHKQVMSKLAENGGKVPEAQKHLLLPAGAGSARHTGSIDMPLRLGAE